MNSRDRYLQLLAYVRPHGRTILQALVCTLVFMALWPLLASIAGEIAVAIAQGNVLAIAKLAGLSSFVFLIQKIAQYGQDSLIAKAALSIVFDLRKQVYAHLQRLSLSYFEKAQSGDLAYRLTEDIDRVGEVVNKIFHQFLPSTVQLIVVLGYMVYLNWQLTLATLVIAPLIALSITSFGEQLRKLSFRSQSRISNLSALLVEVFSGMRLVQAFAAEDYMLDRFSREAERNRRARYRTEQLKAIQLPVVGFLESASLLLLLLLGGWQVHLGNLTGGAFVSYLTAVLMLIDPISLVTSNYNEFKQGEASIDRIFELLNI
ncbi:MAG: ABC transporter ATP-binding protein, partial [Kovacikia sp.]